ncbi:cytochrome P450 [Tanacetum coccineum]
MLLAHVLGIIPRRKSIYEDSSSGDGEQGMLDKAQKALEEAEALKKDSNSNDVDTSTTLNMFICIFLKVVKEKISEDSSYHWYDGPMTGAAIATIRYKSEVSNIFSKALPVVILLSSIHERLHLHKRSDWANVEEDVDSEVDEEVEEKRNEFCCVACGKKFKSDKKWKNHEHSKKHKEKVAELRDAFSDEDRENEDEEEEDDGFVSVDEDGDEESESDEEFVDVDDGKMLETQGSRRQKALKNVYVEEPEIVDQPKISSKAEVEKFDDGSYIEEPIPFDEPCAENGNNGGDDAPTMKQAASVKVSSKSKVSKQAPVGDQTKFLRDALLGLMLAGKDTTSSGLSWFFYVLAKHPKVENNILEEIQKHVAVEGGKRWNVKMLSKMVYLRGALCESLRLFPPVPFNHKSPLLAENLPSGNKVDQNTRIILPIYSMGRMKAIWGNDCMEFKPERWVSKGVGIKHEPSYKFVTFGSGPRACVGKDMALSQLKIVSGMIIYHYHIDLVEGHHVIPTNSMVLNMEHSLSAMFTYGTLSND